MGSSKNDGPVESRTRTGYRLYGAIAHMLGAAILAGEYVPGERLPGEIEFSKSLNVSRTAYREAVQILAAKSLVESRPKAGTRVLPRAYWNLLDPDVLAWAFVGKPNVELVQSLFELRVVIEPAAAGLAAKRRSNTELQKMKGALTRMRRYTLASEEGRSADRDFHRAILAASHNQAFFALSASIDAAIRWTTEFKQRTRELPRNPIPEHLRVYDEIAAGDSDAASEAMRYLVELALDDTRNAMSISALE